MNYVFNLSTWREKTTGAFCRNNVVNAFLKLIGWTHFSEENVVLIFKREFLLVLWMLKKNNMTPVINKINSEILKLLYH